MTVFEKFLTGDQAALARVISHIEDRGDSFLELLSSLYPKAGNAVKIGFTNLTSENYIGTAATGAPDGTGAKINLKGAVDENQSGLTAGQSYYVQTDGTLGTTPADPSVFAGTAVAATKLIVKG